MLYRHTSEGRTKAPSQSFMVGEANNPVTLDYA